MQTRHLRFKERVDGWNHKFPSKSTGIDPRFFGATLTNIESIHKDAHQTREMRRNDTSCEKRVLA